MSSPSPFNLDSALSSLSTAAHEVLSPNMCYPCWLESVERTLSSSSKSQAVTFQWSVNYKNPKGHTKTTTKRENFWLINKEGEPVDFSKVLLRKRLESFGVPKIQLDTFVWPWNSRADGTHDVMSLIQLNKTFNCTTKESETSDYLEIQITDPTAVSKSASQKPLPVFTQAAAIAKGSHIVTPEMKTMIEQRKMEKINKRKSKKEVEPVSESESEMSDVSEIVKEPPKKPVMTLPPVTEEKPKKAKRSRSVKVEPSDHALPSFPQVSSPGGHFSHSVFGGPPAFHLGPQ